MILSASAWLQNILIEKKRFTFFCFVYRHCKVKKEHPVYSHNFGYEPCEKTVSGGAYTRIN